MLDHPSRPHGQAGKNPLAHATPSRTAHATRFATARTGKLEDSLTHAARFITRVTARSSLSHLQNLHKSRAAALCYV